MVILVSQFSLADTYELIEKLPMFIIYPLLGFVCFIFYQSFAEIIRDSLYDDYIYLPSFKSWNKEKSLTSLNGDVTLKDKI
jgi:hypothetical protein